MKYEQGQVIKFKASANNTGVVTISDGRKTVVLHRNEEPLKGGDLIAGQEITIDRITGQVQDKQ